MKTDDDPKPLEGIPLKDIIKTAEEVGERDFRSDTELAPFLGLSAKTPPARALGALKIANKLGMFPGRFWDRFLQHETRKNDSDRTIILTAGRLSELTTNDFSNIIYEASRWLEINGLRLRNINPGCFNILWKKCLSALTEEADTGNSSVLDSDRDLITPAINAPAGFLAQMLMIFPEKESENIIDGFDKKWTSYVTDLVNLPDPSGVFAITIFSHNAIWFFHHDPVFAEKIIVDYLISSEEQSLRSEAAWSGLFWGGRVPPTNLYKKLKSTLLNKAKDSSGFRKRHREGIAWLLLLGWASNLKNGEQLISDEEFRQVLIVSTSEFRLAVLQHLSSWCREKDSKWAKKFPTFVKNVWPRQRTARTAAISTKLVNITLEIGADYPQAVEAVLPVIDRIESTSFFLPPMRDPEAEVFREHPDPTIHLLYAALPEDANYWPYGARSVVQTLRPSGRDREAQRKLAELRSRTI